MAACGLTEILPPFTPLPKSVGMQSSRRFPQCINRPLVTVLCTVVVGACNWATDDGPNLLTLFDSMCVSTWLDEVAFHAMAKEMDGPVGPVPEADLRVLSPSGIAAYAVEFEGLKAIAVMAVSESDDVTSRSCSIMAQGVSFKEAMALVSENFDVEPLRRFTQGANRYELFSGRIVGYPDIMGVGVQSTGESSSLFIFELPHGIQPTDHGDAP